MDIKADSKKDVHKHEIPNKKKTRGIDQWKALITSFLMQSLILGTIESYGALYVPIMDEVLVQESQTGTKSALIGSLTTGFLMGFSPISSWMIDGMGAQLIALFGGVIVFMATLATSFVHSFLPMALYYGVIFGIGCSMLFISSNVVISRYFEDNSTVAYGILGFGNGLMNSIMPHVISYSVSKIKVAGTIRIISFLLCFIMFFPLYWNSDSSEEFDETTMGYLPTRLGSRYAPIRDDIPPPLNPVALPTTNVKLKIKEENQNYHSSTRKWRTKQNSNKRNFQFSNLNVSNQDVQLSAKVEKMLKPPFFPIKRDITMDDPLNGTIDSTIKSRKTDSDIKFPEISLFKKALTSKSTSSFEDDFFMKFSKKSSLSSIKTKENFLSIFKRMKCFQAEIFQSKPYVTLLIAMPIAMLGYQVPNVHIVKYAQKAVPGMNGQLLLTCLGGASAIGPFINGIIIDKVQCNLSKYRLYQIFVLAYGMVILILPLMTKFYALIVMCLIIGFLDGSFSSLLGPLTIDLVGVHKAGQAIGTFYGFVALSVIIAPPLAGFLYDYTSTYEYAFYPAGLCFIIGGLVLSISHTVSKEELNTRGDFSVNVFNQDPSEASETPESEFRSQNTQKKSHLFQR